MSFRDQNINWPSSSFGCNRNFPSDKLVRDFNDGLRTRTLSSSSPRSFNSNISNDSRSQNRSMSEPPEDHPNNSESSAHNNTNPTTKCQQVRQIPIFVEGRDVPVLARDFTKDTAPPEQLFGQENVSFYNSSNNMGNKTSIPRPQTAPNKPRRADIEIKSESMTKQPESSQETYNELVQPSPQPQEKSIEKIQTIQKNVLSLINEVEQFRGGKNDKKYLYLDEMLTRNLLNLDNIDTEGKENIRKARKEAIKCIESCISILEKKAATANTEDSTNQEENTANTETRAVLVPKEEIAVQQSPNSIEAMDQDCDQDKEQQNTETRAVWVQDVNDNGPNENRAILVENPEKQFQQEGITTATNLVTNQN